MFQSHTPEVTKKRHSKIGQINKSEKPRKNKELVADVHTSSC